MTATLKEIEGETPFNDAETRLIAEAPSGVVIFGMTCPEDGAEAPRLRAGLIRHLLLGGCDTLRLPSRSVTVAGARITGELDLIEVTSLRDLDLRNRRFDTMPDLTDASLGGVYLPGCALPGLHALRLRTTRNLHLRAGFTATGPVDLRGAHIGGQLACAGGSFHSDSGPALDGDAMTVGADVFLRDGFRAEGEVVLVRADITGSLQCHGGRFDGGLDLEAATIGATLHLHDVDRMTGLLDLTDAQVGRLRDDAASYGNARRRLSGFRYDRLDSAMSIAERLHWLAQKAERRMVPAIAREVDFQGQKFQIPLPWIADRPEGQCDPQPYTQLAAVLRRQGIARGAARVLEARDRRLRRATWHRARLGLDGSWSTAWTAQKAALMRPVDWLFGKVVGYGHTPGRALYWVLGLWLLSTLLYAQVWATHQMAPASAMVLTSQDWIAAVTAHDADPDAPLPLAVWLESPVAQDYTTFKAALYALDVFIPLDALGQEAAWGASPVRGTWGILGFYLQPVIQIAGWLITAIGAAALAGLVGRRD